MKETAMNQKEQSIQTLNKVRKLIREMIKEENLISSDTNPEQNGDKSLGSGNLNNDQSKIEPTPDADKCLSQIQDLLNWYFG